MRPSPLGFAGQQPLDRRTLKAMAKKPHPAGFVAGVWMEREAAMKGGR